MTPHIGVGESIALGVVQGATEFLPVSSDGHLALGAMLFRIPDMPLTFVVALHAGTLAATLIVFGRELLGLARETARGASKPGAFLRSEPGRLLAALVAACIPTAVIGLLLEERVEAWATAPWIVGACLLGSAAACISTRFARAKDPSPTAPPALLAAALIGIAQGLAVLPGLSRSACTIACAMLLGLSGPAAFRFSFLLSIPAVGGALLLKLRDAGELSGAGASVAIGVAVALVTGYVALRWLRAIVARGNFWMFALYLVPLGAGLILWDALKG